jgi:hypothetical protein
MPSEVLDASTCNKKLEEWFTQNTTELHPHAQDHTQYRQPTVKEHDHHWDLQQDLN